MNSPRNMKRRSRRRRCDNVRSSNAVGKISLLTQRSCHSGQATLPIVVSDPRVGEFSNYATVVSRSCVLWFEIILKRDRLRFLCLALVLPVLGVDFPPPGTCNRGVNRGCLQQEGANDAGPFTPP